VAKNDSAIAGANSSRLGRRRWQLADLGWAAAPIDLTLPYAAQRRWTTTTTLLREVPSQYIRETGTRAEQADLVTPEDARQSEAGHTGSLGLVPSSQ
jgi:hypothetical protein